MSTVNLQESKSKKPDGIIDFILYFVLFKVMQTKQTGSLLELEHKIVIFRD